MLYRAKHWTIITNENNNYATDYILLIFYSNNSNNNNRPTTEYDKDIENEIKGKIRICTIRAVQP